MGGYPRRCGEHIVSLSCFVNEHSESRNVGVPLDEGRDWTKTRQRMRIELPYRLGHRRAMVVDQDRLAIGIVDRMPGKMDFLHSVYRQPVKIGNGILCKILRGHIDVVHVTQQATAC